MGNIAAEMVRLATDATINGDVELARRVMGMDDEIDEIDRMTLHTSVLTLMQQAPVASELRLIVSTMGVVGEIERVADDAVKLARRAKKLSGHFPSEMKLALHELGEQARKAFMMSIKLYSEFENALAEEIIRMDHEIDTRYVIERKRVFEMIAAQPQNTEMLVRTIDAFHHLEHVADHAVEIASRLRILNNNHSSSSALA